MKDKKPQKALDVLEGFRAKAAAQTSDGKDDRGASHYLIDFHMGNACMMLSRYEKALPHFQAALQKKADFEAALQNVAICHYELHHHLDAARCFLNLYDRAEKKEARFLYFSAVSFLAANRFQDAMNTFERLFAAHKNQQKQEWLEQYVHACLSGGRNRKALPFIEQLIRQTDGERKTRWQEVLLHQYVSLDMKKRALRYADTLTRQYPLEPKWWKALVHIHLSANHYKEALVALTAYGFLTPLSREEKKLMADLNATLNIPIQAARYYKDILGTTPDSHILRQLVYACLNMHQPEEALIYAQKGLQLTSAPNDFLFLKGRILFEMQRYADAAVSYESALRHQPDNGEAWLMLGYAALSMDNIPKAKYAFQHALKSPKHRKNARKLLASLEKRHAHE